MLNPVANEPVIDKDAALEASRKAILAVEKMSEDSEIVNPRRAKSVPRYAREQLVLGSLLGRGGFSDVYEVKKIDGATDMRRSLAGHRTLSMPMLSISRHQSDNESVNSSSSDDEKEHVGSRAFLLRRTKTRKIQYAVKFLSLSTMTNPESFATGAADLAIEGHFLSSLDHPNIIKLRGLSNGGIEGFAKGRGGGYFLVLDRLAETLHSRLSRWQQKQGKSSFFSSKNADRDSKKHRYFARCLNIASNIASALDYMHSWNVIYRDLKPENVGFDVNDEVKIFDFGFTKELREADSLDDGLYNLTGNTGSPRYMAPEVGRSMPYNLSADVYSFSTLMWELCTLEQPYSGMTPTTHRELVINGPYRPPIDEDWPINLRRIMERGWSGDINERPSMMDYCTALEREIVESTKENKSPMERRLKRGLSQKKLLVRTPS